MSFRKFFACIVATSALFSTEIALSSAASSVQKTTFQELKENHWIAETGKPFQIKDQSRKWLLVAIAYTDCETFCPINAKRLKDLENQLQAQKPAPPDHVFVLISLNPSKDTPAKMAAFMQKHHLDSPMFTFIRGDEAQTRELVGSMDMSYGEFRGANRHIMHSSKLAVIDPSGKTIKVLNLENIEAASVF